MLQPDPKQTNKDGLQGEAMSEEDQARFEEQQKRKAILANTVANRIREAMAARQASGIEEIWEEDDDQYNGFDELSHPAKGVKESGNAASRTPAGRSKVFLNITRPKADSGIARVQEMLLPHDDKPWEIEPTPVPELIEAASGKDPRMLTLTDGTQATAELVAKTAMAQARDRADKMSAWIEDQFVEGGIYGEMRKVIKDSGRIGSGVLKGPYPVVRESRKWNMQDGVSVLDIIEKVAPESKRIDPRDFFPDPACGECIHDGSYTVERCYMTARQLRKLAKTEGYDAAAIAQALAEGPKARGRDRDRFRDNPGETIADSDVFELYYYYGDCSPEDLIAMGVAEDTIDPTDLQLMSCPAVVTMLNDRPIKAVVNPLETGEFPYDVFTWEPVAGQVWGRGIPRKMAVAQRILNAAIRALLENAGLSAGAQIAIMKGALAPADGKYEIIGRKLWFFTPNDAVTDIRQAMNVWTIASVQQELSNIVQFALQMADELTNLPMIMQGQSNREGGASAETFGGMTLALNAASAPLRVIAKQSDDQMIVPHLKRYYDWGMQDPDVPEEAKGDMQVKARGSTALVQREIAREFLMQIYPLSQDPKLKINPEKMAAEMARGYGYNLAAIQYSDEEWQAIQEQQAQQPAPTDPRIQAAQIRAESEKQRLQVQAEQSQKELQWKAAESQAQREFEALLKGMEREIEMMELAGQTDISLAQIKAQLAQKAVDSRDKRELAAAEYAFARTTGDGRGI